MYHYVALIWSPLDPQMARSAGSLARALDEAVPAWEHAFAAPGMRVYSRRPRTADLGIHRLAADHGMILGRLFPFESDAPSADWTPDISEEDARRYVVSSGRRLAEQYWGAYIAFLVAPNEPRAIVFRDPSGGIPCYRLQHAGVHIVFSDIGDLLPFSGLRVTLDIPLLAAFIYRTWLQVRRTGFAEVTEILAGESFELRGSRADQRITWSPRSIAADRIPLTYAQAAERLGEITQTCIDAWASVNRRVLHLLSGGFDSSVVLGCLCATRPPPSVTCLNQFAERSESDERGYARLCARRAGVPLIEAPWDRSSFAFDARMLSLPPLVRPSFPLLVRHVEADAMNRVAERYAVDAIWTGQGGDHLFLKDTGIDCAADFVLERGIAPGLLRAVRDDAHASRRPYALVLRSALARPRDGIACRSPRATLRPLHFVRREALPDDVDRFITHPWALESEGLPPGKRRHIELIADAVNRHRPLPGREYADQHHPLLSQPIVEHCLRTPTYLLLRGGRHRALARDAFADRIPAAVMQRESKGEMTASLAERIRQSEPLLCELMLDGVLVSARIVERAALERILREGRALMPDELPPLLACIAAEVWARSWSGRSAVRPPVAAPATGHTGPPSADRAPPDPAASTGTSR